VLVKIIAQSVGDITDADATLAASAHATVVGFKTKVEKSAAAYVDVHKVRLFTSDIVYELVQSLEQLFAADAGPVVSGRLSTLVIFNQKRLDEQLVGGRLEEGMMRTKQTVAIYREGVSVGRGRITTIRHQKDTLQEAEAVMEIGLVINSPIAIEVGDDLRVERAQ
jgi:translation initiation factor IF-2